MNMNFATVILSAKGKDKNLAVTQLEKGMASTNIMKAGDNVSKYLEDLLVAEKTAIDGKLGVHNKKVPPPTVYTDLVHDTKRAKDYEQMFMKRKSRIFPGVVEYCFSGMRFKIRLNGEGCCIALNLFGVKTMASDKNQPTLMEYANDAKKYAQN